ncbi:hypothetical protein VCRA2114E365_310037 [Vibrio crassostreae]|nr:hypothetical protein VCRA2113O354_290037 [Vibrio crassostreae]CAK1982764.1 hypothetical protein VCRA2113O358_290022 [Vibrio crassostreae]CAK2026664.1 hypothetical protein VCRA2115O371_300023 [Vibrio crassostreae]CAK2037614.1 hypothetical protein VCRA2113O357_300038 [Vibrio crassostreae]CAK2040819.1 hypothetical protein VCRA2113O362_300038 [Vibrio crassostreae]
MLNVGVTLKYSCVTSLLHIHILVLNLYEVVPFDGISYHFCKVHTHKSLNLLIRYHIIPYQIQSAITSEKTLFLHKYRFLS